MELTTTTPADPEATQPGQLLTGARLLAGDGSGPVRCCHLARILGVRWDRRSEFYAWLDREALWCGPRSPFWGEHPTAYCVRIEDLREALRRAAAVPFSNTVGIPVEEVTP